MARVTKRDGIGVVDTVSVVVLAGFSFLLYSLTMSSPLSSQSNFFPFATVMSAHSLTLSRAGAGQSVAPSYDIML